MYWRKAKLEGIVHPKMKIQSLSTHPRADRRSGESFLELLGVSHEKGVAVTSQTIEVNGDQFSN